MGNLSRRPHLIRVTGAETAPSATAMSSLAISKSPLDICFRLDRESHVGFPEKVLARRINVAMQPSAGTTENNIMSCIASKKDACLKTKGINIGGE